MPNHAMKSITDETAAGHLKKYFEIMPNKRPRYSGSKFETFTGGGDVINPNQITAADLIAVSMLSVHVPGQAALGIMENLSGEIEELLKQVPVGLHLEDLSKHGFGRLLDIGSPADQLWQLLRQHADTWGIGQTTASKILARKRPHLIPIYDSIVKERVGLSGSGEQWVRWWEAFQGEEGRKFAIRLESIRKASGQSHLSLLRVIDIVLWMDGNGAARSSETVDGSD